MGWRRLPVDGYVFAFGEGQQAWDPAFPAQATLLDTTKRSGRVGDETSVEADHAGFDPFADPQAAGEVGGVDVRDEAVLAVVGELDCLILGREGDDRGDWPEDFRPQNLCIGIHIGENCRGIEESGSVRPLAAGADRGPGLYRPLDQTRDLVARGGVHQG